MLQLYEYITEYILDPLILRVRHQYLTIVYRTNKKYTILFQVPGSYKQLDYFSTCELNWLR